VPVLQDVHLDLEELDLESLQELAGETLSETGPVSGLGPESPDAFEPDEVLTMEEDTILTLSGLEELETSPADFIDTSYSPDLEPGAAEPDDSLAHLPEAATLLGIGEMDEVAELAANAFVDEVPEPAPVIQELSQELAPVAPEPVFDLAVEELAIASAAGGQVPAVPGQDPAVAAEPSPATTEQARAVVQAMLADPVLVDALVKAVVARMGDQVLREIAWEVMPDLAGRLQG